MRYSLNRFPLSYAHVCNRLTYVHISHYYSAPIIEALYVFGQTNPRLFWQYLLAVHSTGTTFYNRPAASFTLSSLRDKLVEIAVQVLDKNEAGGKGPKSKIFGELRDALEVKASDNGGNEGTEGLKYSRQLISIHTNKADKKFSQARQTEWNPSDRLSFHAFLIG